MTQLLDKPAAARIKSRPEAEQFIDPAGLIEPVKLWSVDEYHKMIEAGILGPDHKVELLEGLIVPKMPEDPIHAAVIYTLVRWLGRNLSDEWAVRGPAPVTTADSEPEPDVVVARGTEMSYSDHHPQAPEIALVVEVANTSLYRDRNWKQRINARAGMAEYWIVHLARRTIERYTRPTKRGDEPHYRQRDLFGIDDVIPVPVPGAPDLPVAAIFPPASSATKKVAKPKK